MACQIEAFPMTLSHVQGHSYCKPLKCDFLYSCAAVDKISTDGASRVPSVVASVAYHAWL